MTPILVQDFFTTTTNAMNNTISNTLSAYIANTSVVNSVSFFGMYQDTAVGSELTIRTIVPSSISADPYRKIMIAILFFCRIISLSSSPFVTIRDLTATVTVYFTMPTGSAKREAERIVKSVCHVFFKSVTFKGLISWIPPEKRFRSRT